MFDPELRKRTDRAKASVRIEEIARDLGLSITKKGKSFFFRCPNPSHKDEDPSCSINVADQFYNCFGCGAGGDVLKLVQVVRNVSFAEALAYIEERGGTTPPSPPRPDPKKGIETAFADPATSQLLGRVDTHWQKTLYRTAAGRRYLKARGLDDADLVKHFRIGFCDGSLRELLNETEKSLLQRVGVLNEKGNSSFYKAITIPILDEKGLPVGFYGRRTIGKGHLGLVGGHREVFNARAWYEGDEIVLTEGPLDALSFYAAGVRNASSLFGTNGWTSHHDRHLKDGTVRSVVLALDSDEAGQKASIRLASELTAKGIRVRRIAWPEGVKDANEFLMHAEGGCEQLHRLFENAPTISAPAKPQTPPQASENKEDPEDPEDPHKERIQIAENEAFFGFNGTSYRVRGFQAMTAQAIRVRIDATSAGKTHTDRLELTSSRSRTGYAHGAERVLGIQSAKVEGDLNRIRDELEQYKAAKKAAEEENAVRPMTREEREEALSLLRSLDLLDQIAKDLTAVGYVGEENNKRLLYLIATSRKLDWPLAALIKGPSSAGKSQLMEYVASLIPPEDVFYFSRISPQALYYMPRDGLVHKLLVIDERDGSADADYSIRTLLTRRRLSLAVVMRDANGVSQTRIFEIDGPISYMESTTTDELNPENENRCFVLFVDASELQTLKIHEAQKEGHSPGKRLSEAELEAIRRRHHNAQRLLERIPVSIPFAGKIRFPSDQVRARRDHQRFLSIISAVAFLHQHQRERVTDEAGVRWIVASPADYRIAYELAQAGLSGGLDELPPPVAAAYTLIRERVQVLAEKVGTRASDLTWTRSDVIEWTGISLPSARRLLARLVEHELVEMTTGSKGAICRYRLTERKPRQGIVLGITPPEEID